MEGCNDEAPFDPSTMVNFRKCLDGKILQKANEILLRQYQEEELKKPENLEEIEKEEGLKNKGLVASKLAARPCNWGQLLADVTCCLANIRYPNDISLLNEHGRIR